MPPQQLWNCGNFQNCTPKNNFGLNRIKKENFDLLFQTVEIKI